MLEYACQKMMLCPTNKCPWAQVSTWLADIAPNVIGCRLTKENEVKNARR